jgi:hypothetical protein
LELQPEWVEAMTNGEGPSTSALARDWVRMFNKITEQVGVRLAELEMPRGTAQEIVDLTTRYIELCDAREHYGGNYAGPETTTAYEQLSRVQKQYRQTLIRDWVRMHKVAGPLFSDSPSA